MNFDEIDIKILHENFDEEMISKIDTNNISKIFNYLNKNGIYYSKDLLLNSLDLFLLDYKEFVKKFENLKNKLGEDYINKLGEDVSLIEIMYEDI